MNKNFRIAGTRNFSFGKIAYSKGLLKSLLKGQASYITGKEQYAIQDAIEILENIQKHKKEQWIDIKEKLGFKNKK